MSYSLASDTYGSESDYDSSSADDNAEKKDALRRKESRTDSYDSDDDDTQSKSVTDRKSVDDDRGSAVASPTVVTGDDAAAVAASPATGAAASPVEDRPSSAKSSSGRRDSSASKASAKIAKKRRQFSRGGDGDDDGGAGSSGQSEGEGGEKDPLPPPEVLLQRAHRRIRRLLRRASSRKGSGKPDAVSMEKCGIQVLDDFIRCVPLARIIFGDFHWRLARAYADLALAYLDLLQLPIQSHEHASTAKTLLTQNVHLSDNSLEKVGILETFLIAYYALGRSSARLDKDAEAEKALLKAEKIHAEFAKLPAADQIVVAEWQIKILLAVARLSAKKKSYVAAEEEFRRCLDLMEAFHESSSDVALVQVLLDLAKMKLSVGTASQIESSIELFHRAHDINVETFDDVDHLATARSGLALGQAYAALDRDESHASAEAYIRKATESLQATLGCGDEETQAALSALAKLLVRMTKTSEAVDVLKSKIRGRFEVEGGEFSEAMAADHNFIANIFLAGGDLERAVAHLKKCVDIRKVVLGPNHRKTRDTLATINSISH